MKKKDYYETLGVKKESSQEEIKAAYRNMAKKWHPDRNPDNKTIAEEKFKDVGEAYETLSDENKRKQYDNPNTRGFGGFPGGFNVDINDIFNNMNEDMFSNFRTQKIQRGRDILARVRITIKEAILGIEKEIELEHDVKCTVCDGKGGEDVDVCKKCNGIGKVIKEVNNGIFIFQSQSMCQNCNGTGYWPKTPCKKCHGYRKEKKKEKLVFKIPGGILSGQSLVLNGKGEQVEDGINGNLQIEIEIYDDFEFKVQGPNLKREIEIPFEIALEGGIIKTKDAVGNEFDVVVPQACEFGRQFVYNKGINNNGKLYLYLKYNLPKLDKDKITKIKEILK